MGPTSVQEQLVPPDGRYASFLPHPNWSTIGIERRRNDRKRNRQGFVRLDGSTSLVSTPHVLSFSARLDSLKGSHCMHDTHGLPTDRPIRSS